MFVLVNGISSRDRCSIFSTPYVFPIIVFSLNERLSEYATGHANIMNRLDQLEQEKENIAKIKEERDLIIAEKEELEATIEKLNFEKQISRQDKM